MPRPRTLTLGLFALACLSVAPPAFADHGKALNGSMVVTNVPTGPGRVPGSLEILGDGSGSETNVLGAFSVELDYDLNFNYGTTPPSPTTFGGAISFTTAKGVLNGFFVGQYTAVGKFEAGVIFVGGTGQFKNATGFAALQGQDIDPTGAVFLAEFEGSIQYRK